MCAKVNAVADRHVPQYDIGFVEVLDRSATISPNRSTERVPSLIEACSAVFTKETREVDLSRTLALVYLTSHVVGIPRFDGGSDGLGHASSHERHLDMHRCALEMGCECWSATMSFLAELTKTHHSALGADGDIASKNID
jgi:hypothetical protein